MQQFITAAVKKYELNVWRVDFNIDPGPVWYRVGDQTSGPVNASAPEFRRGIVEAGYIRGLCVAHRAIVFMHFALLQ
jgi:hypothetical protein